MESIMNLARPAIRSLVPYSSARMESSPEGIRLDANESPFMREDGMNRYPNPQPLTIKKALALLYGVEPSQLLLTRGSDEGIDLLTRAFCEANQDNILITPPTYGMYEVAASIQGVGVVKIPLKANRGFSLDTIGVLEQLNNAIKLIFVCSPNNPSGNSLVQADVLTLSQAYRTKALVIVDEAYIEFSTAASLSNAITSNPNLVILRTLSKAYGLAGARLGALIANEEIIALLANVIAPYPIPTPVEQVVINALSTENQAAVSAQIQNIRIERDLLQIFLESLPSVQCVYPSQANFLLVKVDDALQWINCCKRHQIIIRSRVTLYKLQNCVRITIGTAEENKRLKEVLFDVETKNSIY